MIVTLMPRSSLIPALYPHTAELVMATTNAARVPLFLVGLVGIGCGILAFVGAYQGDSSLRSLIRAKISFSNEGHDPVSLFERVIVGFLGMIFVLAGFACILATILA